MRWLKRIFLPLEDRWPTRTPPTSAAQGRPVFHCPACKTPVADSATTCPSCAAELPTGR